MEIFEATSSESSYPWIAFRDEIAVVEVWICFKMPMYVRKSSGSGTNDLVFYLDFLSISFFNNRAICLPDKCLASATRLDIMACTVSMSEKRKVPVVQSICGLESFKN